MRLTLMSWRLPVTSLLLVVLLAGCAAPLHVPVPASGRNTAAVNQARNASTAVPTETLVWSVWGSAWELNTNRRVARLFEAEHPEVKIEIVHHEWEEYFDW